MSFYFDCFITFCLFTYLYLTRSDRKSTCTTWRRICIRFCFIWSENKWQILWQVSFYFYSFVASICVSDSINNFIHDWFVGYDADSDRCARISPEYSLFYPQYVFYNSHIKTQFGSVSSIRLPVLFMLYFAILSRYSTQNEYLSMNMSNIWILEKCWLDDKWTKKHSDCMKVHS